MEVRYILTDYVNQALAEAIFDKLEDVAYDGRIPSCPGVVASAANLKDCEA